MKLQRSLLSWIDLLSLVVHQEIQSTSFFYRPKYALASIRKRMKDSNPHVVKYALVVSTHLNTHYWMSF